MNEQNQQKVNMLSEEEMDHKTKEWVELVRVTDKIDAVHLSAGSLLQKGGDLVIRRKGTNIVVHLQHSH